MGWLQIGIKHTRAEIIKCVFVSEIFFFFEFSINFVLKSLVDNIPALVHVVD